MTIDRTISTSEPALTTIAQPIAAMGQECIAQLLERIHLPEKQPMHIMLPVVLIERAVVGGYDEQTIPQIVPLYMQILMNRRHLC